MLCALVIRKKEEEWIKEKSCVIMSLAKQREFLSYAANEEKLQVMLQTNENLIVYTFFFYLFIFYF